MSDDHPVISQIKDYATDPRDESIEGIARGFAVLPDPARVEVMTKMKAWTEADDDASLRQRAQLLNLTRTMNVVHKSLRRVGR